MNSEKEKLTVTSISNFRMNMFYLFTVHSRLLVSKNFYKNCIKSPKSLIASRFWGFNDSYYLASTGYTLACFLSRPLRSNLRTPSTRAYKVSSPPRPTLTPG